MLDVDVKLNTVLQAKCRTIFVCVPTVIFFENNLTMSPLRIRLHIIWLVVRTFLALLLDLGIQLYSNAAKIRRLHHKILLLTRCYLPYLGSIGVIAFDVDHNCCCRKAFISTLGFSLRKIPTEPDYSFW
jgi:hypothetical protein